MSFNDPTVTASSVAELVRQRARTQPDTVAFTFIDYEVDPAGFAESMTWAQIYRRAQAVAEELLRIGKPGDRAAILAPQGLDYIVAFLGAMQAGFIAVPLSVPQFGGHDERVSGALRDCSPAVDPDDVCGRGRRDAVRRCRSMAHLAPRVIEIDALDLDSPRMLDAIRSVGPYRPAYLQYTSGSTRAPAGVMVSHRNVLANLEQVLSDYFERSVATAGHHCRVVAALLSRHGFDARRLAPRSSIGTSVQS